MVNDANVVPLLPSRTVTSLTLSSGGAAWAVTPEPSVPATIVLVATATRSRTERARIARSPVVSPGFGDAFQPYIGRAGAGPYAYPRGETATPFRVGTASGRIRVQRALGEHREEVLDREVALLDVSGGRRGNPDRDVRHRRQRPARGARQADHRDAGRVGYLGGSHHVGGVAARRDRDEDVAVRSYRLDLPGEHPVGAVIVRDRGKRRRVGGQRDRAHGRTRMVERQGAHELRREVLCIRGASPVAADQQGVRRAERFDQQLARGNDVVQARGPDLAQQRLGVAEVAVGALAPRIRVHVHDPLRESGRESDWESGHGSGRTSPAMIVTAPPRSSAT